jgi:hypothetical protein
VCFHPATSSKKAQSNFKKEVSIGDGGFGFSRGSHDNCSITISKKYNQPLKGSEYWRWWFWLTSVIFNCLKKIQNVLIILP